MICQIVYNELMENTHPKTSPRDFFLYLLAVGLLYVCVWRYIDLLFEYINASFPDNVEQADGYNWAYDSSLRAIRSSMAALMILFPVYLGVTWFLRKDIIAHPEKRGLWIRRWLLTLTLFLASVMMIADLVTLVNNFLEGELTVRFLLKVLTVFLAAAAVFGYYFWDLKREITPISRPSKLLAVLALFIVFGGIAGGFFIIGSPGTQRLRRFDEQRVSHLLQIQDATINFWQYKKVLPAQLDDLRNELNGFAPPKDPQTGKSYEYRSTGNLAFELCAEFSLASKVNVYNDITVSKPHPLGVRWNDWNWQHEAGKHCFERTIDPDIYPPLPQK